MESDKSYEFSPLDQMFQSLRRSFLADVENADLTDIDAYVFHNRCRIAEGAFLGLLLVRGEAVSCSIIL